MNIDLNEWVSAALDPEFFHLAELIASLPPSRMQSTAASLVQRSPLDRRVYALRSISQDYSVGGSPELAVSLALVGIRLCERSYELYGSGEVDVFVYGVAQFALDGHRAYDRMDQHQNQLDIIVEALGWLQARKAEERHLIDLRFARIEALIELGLLEEARERLDAETVSGNTDHPLHGLLDQRIASRLISATRRKDDRSTEEKASDDQKKMFQAAIEGLSRIAPQFADVLEQLGQQAEKQHEIRSPSEFIAGESEVSRQYADFLESMAGDAGKQIQMNTAIQQSVAVLMDPERGRDKASLDQIRQSLEAVQQEALDIRFEDTAIDVLWPLYLCEVIQGFR